MKKQLAAIWKGIVRLKRRRFLINRKFQFSFLFYMFLLTALMILIMFYSNILFLNSCYDVGIRLGLPSNHVYFELLNSQKFTMQKIFLTGALTTLVCLTFFGILLSHRIAGPLYRMRLYIEALTEGKTTRDLEFRKDDYFDDLADSLSELAEKIGARERKKRD
jgi:hypothetical protein